MKKPSHNFKYWIYPILILLSVLLLSTLKINGSSVEIFRGRILSTDERDSDSLFGRPRAIRSDQYLVTLPMFISQDINNEATVNNDIGEGTNLITQNIPTRNIFAIFRPTHIPFFFSDNSGFSYSFSWWAEMGLLLIGVYLLLLELTKKNLSLSITGSLLFLITPFTQWWNQTNIIAWISIGIFFALRVLKEKSWWKSSLYGLGLAYSIITFALFLYPAFQVPVAYVAIAIALGFCITNWKEIKKNLKISIPVILLSALVGISFILFFITKNRDVIEIISNTVYPGARFIESGGGDTNLLFNGLYNILLQRDSNTAPFGNQSESSNFFLLFPPLLLWVLYKNINLFRKHKKLDWIGISVSSVLLFFLANYFIPLPSIITKITLMYLVPHQRLLIGFGFASYILMLWILSNKKIYSCDKSIKDRILVSVLSISFGVLIYFVGKNLYTVSPDFFNFPEIVSPTLKILAASIFAVFLIFTLLRGYKKIFLIALLSFAFLSTVYVNPIRRGLDVLTDTEVAHYIRDLSEKDDSKWVVYGDHTLAQYALANNANILNGVHIYPQFKIWEVLDPEKKYMDVYNRYAHVMVSTKSEDEEDISLIAPDALVLNIDPCDEKLKQLDVKYYLSNEEMPENTCLNKLKQIDKVSIYERID